MSQYIKDGENCKFRPQAGPSWAQVGFFAIINMAGHSGWTLRLDAQCKLRLGWLRCLATTQNNDIDN